MNHDTNDIIVNPTDNGPWIVYGAYLANFLVPVLAAIAGLVWAYVSQGQAGGVARSHYRFAIRTFWMALLYSVISTVLFLMSFGLLGFLTWPLVAIWWLVRVVKGMVYFNRGQAHPNPESWLVG